MRFYQIINESEARIKFLAQKYGKAAMVVLERPNGEFNHLIDEVLRQTAGDSEPEKLVNYIAKFDPTPSKKYTQWLVDRYSKGLYRLEDLETATPRLDLHRRLVQSKRLENPDIFSVDDLTGLFNLLKPYLMGELAVNASDAERKKFLAPEQTKVIHWEDGFYIVAPLTWDSERHWGANTNWCTVAGEGHFNRYMERGQLYIIGYGDRRWQFHFPNEFRKEDDAWADWQNFPPNLWSYFDKEILWSIVLSDSALEQSRNLLSIRDLVIPYVDADEADVHMAVRAVRLEPVERHDGLFTQLCVKLIPKVPTGQLVMIYQFYQHGSKERIMPQAMEKEIADRDDLSHPDLISLARLKKLPDALANRVLNEVDWEKVGKSYSFDDIEGIILRTDRPEIADKFIEHSTPIVIAAAFVAHDHLTDIAIKKKLYVALRRSAKPEHSIPITGMGPNGVKSDIGRYQEFNKPEQIGSFLYELGRFDIGTRNVDILHECSGSPRLAQKIILDGKAFVFKSNEGEMLFAFTCYTDTRRFWFGNKTESMSGDQYSGEFAYSRQYRKGSPFFKACLDILEGEYKGMRDDGWDDDD